MVVASTIGRDDTARQKPFIDAHGPAARRRHEAFSQAATVAVELVTVEGMGHQWPTSPINATDVIWRFFSGL